MEVNPDKFHLLTSSSDELKLCINDDDINSTKCKKLLGAMIDSKLSFNTHINVVCYKKNRTNSFCIVQNNSFYVVAKEAALNECIFPVSI